MVAPVRIACVGKGGSGKSVIAGTLARLLARRGAKLLALDSDPIPGLAISLGLGPLRTAMLADAAARGEQGRWQLKKGIGPARAVQRYSALAPDGVRLLQYGKPGSDGMAPIMGSLNAFYQLVHRLARSNSLRDWTIVGDLPAGPRQSAFNWAPYAEAFVLVVEPSWQSVLTARRIARIVRSRGDVAVLAVANKVEGLSDAGLVEQRLGEEVLGYVPADEAAVEADRLGVALLDHAPDCSAVAAIRELAEALEQRSLGRVKLA